MYGRTAGLLLAGLLLATTSVAQEAELEGQLRPRFEVRDPVGTDGTVEFMSMRTRASLRAALEGGVTAFVQFQDVRTFGEETNTLTDFSADGLDLHQGWIELGAPTDEISLRLGRQEAVYGGERLVGAVNWTQQARAFDGLRARIRPSTGVVVDGLAFRISNEQTAPNTADESFYGLYSTLEAAGALDLYTLWNNRTEATGATRDRVTLGGRWVSARDAFRWRLEGAYQGGGSETAGGVSSDIAAFMLGARVGTRVLEDVEATLWYDYLSGDDDPGDDVVRVFNTLFATNHKFYGHMDFFLDIPASTNGRGLQDLAVKATYDLDDGRTLGADLHTFHLAATDGLDTGHIGEELDVSYRWGYVDGVALTGGISYFLAADAWSTVLGNADENQLWGYLMVDVTF